MKTLPLFYYPNTWVLVDDNHTVLNTMTEAFSKKCAVKSFLSSEECLRFLKNYISPLSKYNFIESDINDENYGLSAKNPMNLDITKIAKLREDKHRHHEITVAILDYQMPIMNGLTLAERIQDFPIQKILLTGDITEIKAIEGFNKNLIQKFIQKSSVSMLKDLDNYTEELSSRYFEHLTKPILAHIEAENKTALSDPVFIDFFEEHCRKNSIKEYYLVDKNGSFLCVDAEGKQSFLVVHTDKSMSEWLAVYKNELHLSDVNMVAISEYKKIPFFGIEKEAWQIPSDEWEKYFYTASTLMGREKYYFVVL